MSNHLTLKKYFLVYEGADTERIYFDTVNSMRENIEESKMERISYETLLNRMMEYFCETGIITTSRILEKSIWKTMVQICSENLQKSLQEEVEDIKKDCNTVVELLKQEYGITHVISDISGIIKEGG